nr:immunoglobulin heavy chain junction region [Mus musculus]
CARKTLWRYWYFDVW